MDIEIEQVRSRMKEIATRCEAIKEGADSDGMINMKDAAEMERLIDEFDKLSAQKVRPPNPRNHLIPTEDYEPSVSFSHQRELLTRDGSKVKVLARGEKLANHMDHSGLTLGGFLRAAVGVGDGSKYRAALTEGTDSTGGFTVPDVIVSQVIDRLRARSVLMAAGATTMVLPAGGEVSMVKLTGDPTAYWHQEGSSVTASTPTFGQVAFQPRTLISLVKASRELLEDSINAEDALMDAFAQALALEVDRVGLLGTGASGEPLGVLNTSGIGNVLMGANGLALSNYDPYVNVVYELTQDNAMGPTAFIQNPRTTKESAVLKDSQNQPLQKPEALQGIPILETTQVPITDTQGSATDASRVYAGYWPDLVWGVRHDLTIEVLREKYSDNFEYGFQAHLRGDFAVRHPESFATITGIIP